MLNSISTNMSNLANSIRGLGKKEILLLGFGFFCAALYYINEDDKTKNTNDVIPDNQIPENENTFSEC
ncbi:hypothetical protein [Mediterraneibacter glycyrrhizinilyticus]|uniref:hypothetical protein n=1 Tax=Mediterraneibacter glycyrrhizinilyticus TaxID=342942 RepID=UPI0025A48B5B|nr:hypothetical protein [Mediterraneibacter glycyrrhizinilyticus]MDM8211212.1 hypothetical protein [Mediterraneibacter glycyrrhizinilyticus]